MRDGTEEVPMRRDNEQWKLCEIMYVTCFKRNNASQMTALEHETHKKNSTMKPCTTNTACLKRFLILRDHVIQRHDSP